MNDDLYFLRQALNVARLSLEKGNLPFGCVLVDENGMLIAEGENTVLTDKDAIAHCEINLVHAIAGKYDRAYLENCTLYASTEPCAMCAAAIFWSGIGRLVYALGKEKYHGIAATSEAAHILELSAAGVLVKGGRKVLVEGPLLEAEAVIFYSEIYK